jgi:hypothetical protein
VRRGLVTLALLAVMLLVAAAVLLSTSSARHPQTAASTTVRAAGTAARTPSATVQALRAPSFTTAYEPGWTLTSKVGPDGVTRHQLSSTGASINGLGLPPSGTVGITIDEDPLSGVVDGRFLSLAGESVLGLLRLTVGTPRGARDVTLAGAPRATTLGGMQAAEEAYTYVYEGRQNTQVDVLGKRDGRSVLVELDAEPTLSRQSQAALELLVADWRWSQRPRSGAQGSAQ